MDNFDEHKEMLEGFIADSHDLLEEIEPKLIELQQSTDLSGLADEDTLNSIFRLFHSLKGAAGFLDLKNVTGVTHEAETLLNLIREGTLVLIAEHTDLLCRTCDLMREMLDHIEMHGNDEGHAEQVATMQALLKQASTGLQNAAAPEPARDAAPAAQAAAPNAVAAPAPERPAQINITVTPEMLKSFIQESDELLENAEQALVDIEKASDREERLDNAFRGIHSFKGNCGFMGFVDPEQLSHAIENVLDHMKSGTLQTTHPSSWACPKWMRSCSPKRTVPSCKLVWRSTVSPASPRRALKTILHNDIGSLRLSITGNGFAAGQPAYPLPAQTPRQNI